MNLLKQIQQLFQKRKALQGIYDDMQNLDQVLLEKRLEILNEIATPRFAGIGLKNWNGKYIWFSDFNDDGIKNAVEYNVFKYFGGSFTFGNCYDFVPTTSGGKKLIYHKTDKATKLIYDRKLEGWQKSDDENSPINIDNISTVNEEKFRKTLTDVLDRNIPKLKEWFEKNQTIEQNISSLLQENKKKRNEFLKRIISFDYILCFLYAQIKDFDSAGKHLNQHLETKVNTETEIGLIRDKLEKLKAPE